MVPGDHPIRPDVPVFNCVVYIARSRDGTARGRVANLAGIESTGASERAVLAAIVPAFKERVKPLVQAGKPIPWIDPPLPMQPDEQPRFIPVHL